MCLLLSLFASPLYISALGTIIIISPMTGFKMVLRVTEIQNRQSGFRSYGRITEPRRRALISGLTVGMIATKINVI